jgi:hypothetical protein
VRVVCSMSALDGESTPPELLSQLWELAPECRHRSYPGAKDGFKLELAESDPRVAQVLQLIGGSGYTQAEYPDRRNKHYRLIRRRRYDEADMAGAPLFWLEYCEVRGSTDGERTEDGLLRLPRGDARKWKEPTVVGRTFIVRDGVKRRLEAGGFKGLWFRPTIQTGRVRGGGGQGPGEQVGLATPEDAWWELAAERTMAPMLRVRRRALTAQREVLPEGVRGPGVLESEGFDDFRPVYTREAVEAVAGMDIVHTWEFAFRPLEPEVLMSGRLRAVMMELQPACRMVPVEVVG